jgi:O-antigen/teichoic acid export membrane protein
LVALSTPITRRRAAADILVQLVGQVLNLALGIFVTVVVVRTLGDTRFGEWSTILALLQIMTMFTNLGLQNIAIRFAASEPEHEHEWLGAAVSLTAAISVPVTILSIVILETISTSPQMRVASVLLSCTLLLTVASAMSVVFRLRVQNHVNVAFTTANSVLWGAAVFAIAAAGGGMVALAIAFLATSAAIQMAQALYALRLMPLRLRDSKARWRVLGRLGVAAGIGTLLTVTYGRVDQVLVFQLAPHRYEPGLYGAVYRLLEQAGFAPAAVMMTLFPIISGAYPSDPVRVRRLLQFALEGLACVSLPTFAFALVAPHQIVDSLFGSGLDRASAALPVLMAAYVAICFGYVAGYMSVVTELQGRFVRFALLGLVFNVGLNLLLVPKWGFRAAAWTTLATELLVVGLELRAILVRIEMRIGLSRLTGAVLASAAGGAVVLGARLAGVPLGGLVPLMLLVYLPLVVFLGAIDVEELRAVFTSRRGEAEA